MQIRVCGSSPDFKSPSDVEEKLAIPMDEKDRLLLTYLHAGIPLVSQPFSVLGTKLEKDSADVLVRIHRLVTNGTIGGIKAALDAQAFGYQGVWVAMRFEPSGLEAHAEVILQHPGVVYACERDHEFNLWFFLAAPAHHDLELHVRCLEKISSPREILFLPVRRLFKGADYLSSLDHRTFPEMGERFEKRHPRSLPDLTQDEIEMLRHLQGNFPLTDEPYQTLARNAGLSEEQVFQRLKSLIQKGFLKRISSFAPLPAVDLRPKPLVVWQIPEEKIQRIGPEISGFREVLYSDYRPSYPGFPYSLYTMIRAESAAELEVVARRIQDRIGRWPHRTIATVREFKKEAIRYFPKALEVWWEKSRAIVDNAFDQVEM